MNAVRAGMNEFAARATVFAQRLLQQFNSTSSFFAALQGAGAGIAFEAAQTVILEIDPPPRVQEDHQRALRSLDEAVRLDREVGRSIGEQDIVLSAVSNIRLGQEARPTGIDVVPAVCAVLVPAAWPRASVACRMRFPAASTAPGGTRSCVSSPRGASRTGSFRDS